MRTGNRIGLLKAALLLAAGAAGGGAALAVASVPDGGGIYHACLQQTVTGAGTTVPDQSGANVTVIDPAAGQHCVPPDPPVPNQTEISWNATGPPGPSGATGARGAPGAQGAPGASGRSVTVVSGQTLTLPGGQVITVAGDPGGVTLAPPPINSRGRGVGIARLPGLPSFGVLAVQLARLTTGRRGVRPSEMVVVTKVDKASARLSQACVNGKHFPTVTVSTRTASGGPGLSYTLHDAVIDAVQVAKTAKTGVIYLVFRFKLVAVKTIS